MKRFYLILLCIFLVNAVSAQQTKDISYFFNSIKSEIDPVQKEQLLLQMKEKFPTDRLLEYSKGMVASAFAEEGNFEKMDYWLNSINDDELFVSTLYECAQFLISSGKLDDAELILLPAIKKSNDNNRAMLSYLYGSLLYKRGDYNGAVDYLKLTPKGFNRELYALALLKTGRDSLAIEEVKVVLSQPGAKSSEFENSAKELFYKIYGNNAVYKNYTDSISKAHKAELYEKISKKQRDEPAPDFTIKDVNGKEVSLKSLRGKIVMLDFWATWCQPCVRSFPAMQKLVDYYAKDTSVVFMFIHTAEKNSTATEEAIKLLKYKNYSFDLYMDLKDSTRKNPLADKFNIAFLPTKIIIDKTGTIRFFDTGFIDENMGVEEVKAMIETCRSFK